EARSSAQWASRRAARTIALRRDDPRVEAPVFGHQQAHLVAAPPRFGQTDQGGQRLLVTRGAGVLGPEPPEAGARLARLAPLTRETALEEAGALDQRAVASLGDELVEPPAGADRLVPRQRIAGQLEARALRLGLARVARD